MIKNYLVVAWRNLIKNKTFSIINIAGLATGLACFILIALYVVDELSYDKYNEKADRIYRINSAIRFGGTDLNMAVASDPMGATLKKDYPEVEEYVRFYNSNGSRLVKKGTEYINEEKVVNADSTLFNVFTLPAIAGDTRTALNEPNTVVITEKMALKYFGDVNAVGKQIETNENGSTLYKVTAVIKDIPANSQFDFDFIFSMDNVDYGWGNYVSHNFHTFLLMRPGTDYHAFEKNFKSYLNRYVLPQAQQFMQINSMEDFEKAGNKLSYSLMPLTDVHLHSSLSNEFKPNGNIQYVYIFSAVALFILLIACINFMNLSTARSANRAKEVGIRKVLGTGKAALIRQFLTESVLMMVIALLVALLMVSLTIDYFNDISGKELGISSLLRPGYLMFLLSLPLVVGALAGSYPAFFLSSFQPITVLKGKLGGGFRRSFLRSGLVVFQFFISITLIVGTIVVFRQLNYIRTTKIGFNKDQVLVLNGTGALGNNKASFKEEITKLPGVKSATYAGFLPVENSSRADYTFSKERVLDVKSGFNLQVWGVDYDYVNTLGMELVKGRNFSKDHGTDSSAILINETAADLLGYTDPIGKKIYSLDTGPNTATEYTIIGVLKNFHFESLRQHIGPVSLRLSPGDWSMAFKVNTANLPALIAGIEKQWKAAAPGMPLSYEFLDDAFDKMYRSEQRVGQVALIFAVLAIIIACLGLFGLATYMSERRTKEIGVRKVLGATVPNIVGMLSRDFVKLVLLAAVLAFPFSWLVMNKWLQDFAYRVDMGWWIFGLAGLITLMIALSTVVFQAVKSALANPVNSLRNE